MDATPDPVELFLGRSLKDEKQPYCQEANRDDRSLAGLKHLAHQYSWGAVLELATSLLANHEDSLEVSATGDAECHTAEIYKDKDLLLPHERLLCEAYRMLALIQTRIVERAANLLEKLGSLDPDNADYRYETYAVLYPGHEPGSFVPFQLSIMAVEIRVRKGDASAIPKCYELKRRFPEHKNLILSALVGYHLRVQQYDAAADLSRELAMSQGATARALYMYMLVLIHIGDFEEAEKIEQITDSKPNVARESRHLYRGLLLSAQGDHEAALEENNLAAKAADERGKKHRKVAAIGNAALNLLHLGNLPDAIAKLENCLRDDPTTALDEGLVFNLCTLYDLAYPDEATEKKKTLHRLASRYGRQGFNLDLGIGAP